MFDLLDSLGVWMEELGNWLNQLGENVNSLVVDLNNLIDNINYYIQVATVYIWGSGAVMIITLVLVIALLSWNRKLNKKLDEIQNLLKGDIKDE